MPENDEDLAMAVLETVLEGGESVKPPKLGRMRLERESFREADRDGEEVKELFGLAREVGWEVVDWSGKAWEERWERDSEEGEESGDEEDEGSDDDDY